MNKTLATDTKTINAQTQENDHLLNQRAVKYEEILNGKRITIKNASRFNASDVPGTIDTAWTATERGENLCSIQTMINAILKHLIFSDNTINKADALINAKLELDKTHPDLSLSRTSHKDCSIILTTIILMLFLCILYNLLNKLEPKVTYI